MIHDMKFKLSGIAAIFVFILATTSFAQQTINWSTQADSLRGRNGGQFTFVCPGGGSISSRVWGTNVYTDDSSICSAAVHAGYIEAASGGTVTIEIRAGQPSYQGVTRNGVTSRPFGSWPGSFVFVGRVSGSSNINWAAQADSLRGRSGQRFTFQCPAGGPASGRLWGTDLYTDDSSICTAGVHAGVINVASGGSVTIEIRPAATSYRGTLRNGITSRSYGGYAGSFVVVSGRASAAAGCGLGTRWEVTDGNGVWSAVWTRRGNGNVFDALWRTRGERDVTGTLSISISGSRVTGYRTTGPNRWGVTTCTYIGTLAGDSVNISGSVSCNTGAGPIPGNMNWSARIICPSR